MNKQQTKTVKINKTFLAASPAEKRVMIARDALKQLKLGKIIAKRGKFVEGLFRMGDKNPENMELQKVLPDINCKVCGLGSLFVSQVRFIDNCKLTDTDIEYGYLEMEDRLKQTKYFSKEQKVLIEVAFEGGGGYYQDDDYADEYNVNKYLSKKKINSAIKFYNTYDGAEERLIAILKNIIKNGGEFVP